VSALLLLLVLQAPPQQPDGDPLILKVNPSIATSPGAVRARVSVDPHADNESLEIVADSLSFYRSSTITLDGELAARSYTMIFERLPAGEYEIRAAVERSDGTSLVEVLPVTILKRKGDK
jgi:hypothetical protein